MCGLAVCHVVFVFRRFKRGSILTPLTGRWWRCTRRWPAWQKLDGISAVGGYLCRCGSGVPNISAVKRKGVVVVAGVVPCLSAG